MNLAPTFFKDYLNTEIYNATVKNNLERVQDLLEIGATIAYKNKVGKIQVLYDLYIL